MTTWVHSADEKSATFSHSADEKSATWVHNADETSASWEKLDMMQFGFLFWEGMGYKWEEITAFNDNFANSQQDESSGKWEDLG